MRMSKDLDYCQRAFTARLKKYWKPLVNVTDTALCLHKAVSDYDDAEAELMGGFTWRKAKLEKH